MGGSRPEAVITELRTALNGSLTDMQELLQGPSQREGRAQFLIDYAGCIRDTLLESVEDGVAKLEFSSIEIRQRVNWTPPQTAEDQWMRLLCVQAQERLRALRDGDDIGSGQDVAKALLVGLLEVAYAMQFVLEELGYQSVTDSSASATPSTVTPYSRTLSRAGCTGTAAAPSAQSPTWFHHFDMLLPETCRLLREHTAGVEELRAVESLMEEMLPGFDRQGPMAYEEVDELLTSCMSKGIEDHGNAIAAVEQCRDQVEECRARLGVDVESNICLLAAACCKIHRASRGQSVPEEGLKDFCDVAADYLKHSTSEKALQELRAHSRSGEDETLRQERRIELDVAELRRRLEELGAHECQIQDFIPPRTRGEEQLAYLAAVQEFLAIAKACLDNSATVEEAHRKLTDTMHEPPGGQSANHSAILPAAQGLCVIGD